MTIDEELLTAAKHGDFMDVCRLLQRGANIQAVDDRQRTALHWAAGVENIKVAKVLLSYGAAVNAASASGTTPLHLACLMGGTKMASFLIKHGAMVNVKETAKGKTPLHLVCLEGGKKVLDLVELLVTHQADTNVKDEDGNTPLHMTYRCREGDTEIASLLLRHGADPNASMGTNHQGQGGTPLLHLACFLGYLDMGQLLLKHGASVHARNSVGQTPLHVACMSDGPAEPILETVRLLLQKGADIHAMDNRGFTALHMASLGSHATDLTAMLLRKGAAVNVQGQDGSTPLHVACQRGLLDVAFMLLGRGAKSDVSNLEGLCPADCLELGRDWSAGGAA